MEVSCKETLYFSKKQPFIAYYLGTVFLLVRTIAILTFVIVMTKGIPQKILARQQEITTDFLQALDQHLADIASGKATDMLEIRDFAALLFIHPTHLSNTIHLTTGHSPCYYFEAKIMDLSKQLLQDPSRSIAQIAMGLTYDPSNFTKFFKRFAGMTPKQYRESILLHPSRKKTETITI